MISKNFNKGGLGATSESECDSFTATLMLLKMETLYFSPIVI